MKICKIKLGIALLAACMLSSQAYALSINDTGVVGTIEPSSGSGSSVSDELAWANYLLTLATSKVDISADADADGKIELYNTGTNAYSVVTPLTGGTKDDSGSLGNITGYEYVLAKYDGPNAGYIMYNVADWGLASLPKYPCGSDLPTADNWCDGEPATPQYALSHWTGFGGTPVSAPTTLLIMSLGLFGVGVGTWKKKHQA